MPFRYYSALLSFLAPTKVSRSDLATLGINIGLWIWSLQFCLCTMYGAEYVSSPLLTRIYLALVTQNLLSCLASPLPQILRNCIYLCRAVSPGLDALTCHRWQALYRVELFSTCITTVTSPVPSNVITFLLSRTKDFHHVTRNFPKQPCLSRAFLCRPYYLHYSG